mmetsp:Transcript_6999/g.12818  ORF Transcript_6999/g.12818 Transcript_6999/m.12818 type:complete len:483 (+) Transcript_6999:73-1521(+)
MATIARMRTSLHHHYRIKSHRRCWISLERGLISSRHDALVWRDAPNHACRCLSSSLAPRPDSSVALLDLQASAKIEGEESQIATVTLKPGQVLRAESGSMIFMTQGVEMEATADNVSGAMKRFMTGQNLFVTDFRYTGESEGTVALGTDFPSKILRLRLEDYPNATLICQKSAYLASNPLVEIEMAFTKNFSSGFFGGQGFVLQKLQGQGDVLVKGGGTIVTKELKEGESLRVTSGSLVAFTDTVDYDVQMVKGAKNVIFGGEGLFMTTLKGPGTVWLQGMPPDRMVSEILRRLPPGGIGLGIPIGGGGGVGEAGEAGEGVEGGVGEEVAAGEAVAATDAAVDADRQATVASSGVDPDSPSALFGDAAPPEAASSSSSSTSASDASIPSLEEDTFGSGDSSWNDETTSSNETTFTDDGFGEESFSTEDSFQDDTLGDDTSFSTFEESSSSMADAASDAASDEGGGVGSVLSTIWDLFMGNDD